MIRTEHRYVPGKVDYNRKGRRNCEAEFTWTLDNGAFSMQAAIWNPRHNDIYVGGQAVAEVASYFPSDAKVQRMFAVWRRWHLNDMRAGTPAQTRIVEQLENPNYENAVIALSAAGLLNDGGYVYGTKWLREELPSEIVREIKSWSETAE